MEDDENEGPLPIVIDNGSFYIKAGFNGDEEPKKVIRNVKGKNNNDYEQTGGDEKEIFIGEKAIIKRGMLNIKFPMKYAVVKLCLNLLIYLDYI